MHHVAYVVLLCVSILNMDLEYYVDLDYKYCKICDTFIIEIVLGFQHFPGDLANVNEWKSCLIPLLYCLLFTGKSYEVPGRNQNNV